MNQPVQQPAPVLLADYRPYPFVLRQTRIEAKLDPKATAIAAELDFTRREAGDLVLDIGAGVDLRRIAINGQRLAADSWTRTGEELRVKAPEGDFTLATEVVIDPSANTAFEGLYLSNGMFCTQCEAEGFRHITPYPDRPDVMAPFEVTIRSDLPVLLSNGNPVMASEGVAVWHDPWPKPAYLFALVAGDLRAVPGKFTTMSGRPVDLNVWVRPGDEPRAGYALDSLIRSMTWDEEAYGREYDLDVFNIVAVDDFNMGAMENKGLNIFNSKLVLATPETATDMDYERIEGVIGHEYFHNWTGNRITCRDWFQLCLKEGLTVFRDQQFTGDMRSAAVKRIRDVRILRAAQFREDQGPLAHPVRPESYVEINNFYTATVYEKGAQVIGMLKRLVGDEGYRKALDLYFSRHDGDAATIEDWLKVFEDATGRDLAQFKRWYSDAGTPILTMTEDWDSGAGRLTLNFTQATPPTPGQPEKPPRVIPIAIGLLSPNGDEVVPTTVLEMTEATQSFSFDGLSTRPTVSALRDFSAPVILKRQIAPATLAFLLAHDSDPFARWEAGRQLARDTLLGMIEGKRPDAEYLAALGRLLADDKADPAFRALCVELPPEEEIATAIAALGRQPDPQAIHAARESLAAEIARMHEDALDRIYREMAVPGPYSPEADAAGKRSLRLTALALLSRIDGGARAGELYRATDNMTERAAALAMLIAANGGDAEVASFYNKFKDIRLVMDMWFLLQPLNADPDRAVEVAKTLAAHPDFDWKNPNRFRALIGGLCGNHAGFHRADGAGYDFLADWLIRMDAVNPQIAARMSSALESWTRYDAGRQAHARAALDRILSQPKLSKNLGEMIGRIRSAT
ncbi:MAG TPA: aminopeptidase N [Paracoccus sp. (in: a-proteobacteria)]|uniref:aminopeptidase N n=1 Tax=uncultured Paracoccus sp. TaxID=189685 RepID=UPI002605F6AB|nr:aminopeptidase N [uncultured Paracoccus sp.]HMQ40103.1 aminopeptidase N [Paracoccus sp. (in: a-proteobacteria)]HMR36457.1 aminopeptidase N [Paracoccus sp. (in: a-proteobacteria)]